jgi:hypothetical protein
MCGLRELSSAAVWDFPLFGGCRIDSMPRSVHAARVLMVIQVVLSLPGVVLILTDLPEYYGPSSLGAWLFVLSLSLLSVVTVIAVAALAAAFSSRKGWVRITAVVVETIVAMDRVFGLTTGEFIPLQFAGIVLAAFVIVLLGHRDAARWFGRQRRLPPAMDHP